MKKFCYMMVTNDEYELPLAVADTIQQLADTVGTTKTAIEAAMYRAKKKGKRCRYVKVLLIDDE